MSLASNIARLGTHFLWLCGQFAAMATLLTGPAAWAQNSREAKVRAHFGSTFQHFIWDNGQGRLDFSATDSRYIFSPNPQDPQSPTYVIPIATSRMEQEVVPPVLVFAGDVVTPIPLQEFLLNHFQRIAKDGKVDLYRGAERADERASWEQRIPAQGARYWTPNANYAWRYARKQPNFLPDVLNCQSPVLHFRVPINEFEQQVRAGRLTLGMEFPRSVHRGLEQGRGFTDLLVRDQLYLGSPEFGAEIEIHSGRRRDLFVDGYVGSLSPTAMVEARRTQIEQGYARAERQWPARQAQWRHERRSRLQNLIEEVTDNDFVSLSSLPESKRCVFILNGIAKP